MGIELHDLSPTARRTRCGQLIRDEELKPYSVGVDVDTSFIAAADLVSVVAAVTPTASGVRKEHTIANQPDIARDLRVRLVDGSSNNTRTTVLLSGTDVHGDPIAETVVFVNGGSATKTTNQCFATVTAVTSYYDSATTTGVTIGVGYGPGIALPVDILTHEDVKKIIVDTAGTPASETVSSSVINAQYAKLTSGTAPDGSTVKYFVTVCSTKGRTRF